MSAKAIPERRCALSGQTAPKPTLLRLVLAPDGALVVDLKQKLPGRGLYVSFDRRLVEKAVKTHKLRKISARHFDVSVADLSVSAAFADDIAVQLKDRTLSMLGLERKAGRVFLGADSVEKAASAGKVAVLLNASDGAGNSEKFMARARAVDIPVLTAFSRAELSLALGRENVVHAALSQRGGWKTLLTLAQAYEQYVGQVPRNDGDRASGACEDEKGLRPNE